MKYESITMNLILSGVGFLGSSYSGWVINGQDIGPNFAGTLLGITNCIGNIPGFVAPAVAAQIVKNDLSNTNNWDLVWVTAVVVLILGTGHFLLSSTNIKHSLS